MSEFSHLDELEAEAIYIIREVAAECEKPVMLYSIGKDSSVMLHLAIKAFYPEKPPFPFLHVNTTWKFREMIEFRDRIAKKYGIEMLEHINQDGVKQGINPFDHGAAYTDIMKTQALKQALNKYGFTAAFGGGRRDEEKSPAATKKSPAPRNASSRFAILHTLGTRKTSVRKCGSFTTPKSTRAKASVFSRFRTGPKKIFGSTSSAKILTSSRFTLQPHAQSLYAKATSSWSMTNDSLCVKAKSQKSSQCDSVRSVATRLQAA